MDEFKRRRLQQDEGRRWSDLPDLALNQIAARVSAPGDFLALSRVCRAWRTVAKASIGDFASSRHCLSQYIFLILGRSQHPYTSGYSNLFLCIADGLLYEHKPRIEPLEVMPKCKFTTHRDEIFVIGQSRNCIIAVDAATRRIPSIIELCCGLRYDFPPLRGKHKLDFALLTESLCRTRSGCMLVLVDSHSSPGRGRLLYCSLDGSRWHSASHPGPIIDAIVCSNMLVINCSTSLLFLRLDKPRHVVHRRKIPAVAREGEGKPLLVLNRHLCCRRLMLLKLNDKSDSVLAYTCYCLQKDGSEHITWEKYPWPVGTNLWLNWLRSDLFCTVDDLIGSGGSNNVRARVVKHDDELWTNYCFESNGVDVAPVADLVVEGAVSLSCFQLLPALFLRGIP